MLLSGHYSWCILVLENLDHVNVFTTEFGNSRHFCAGMRFNQVSEYILAHNAEGMKTRLSSLVSSFFPRITCFMVLYMDKVFSFALLDGGASRT